MIDLIFLRPPSSLLPLSPPPPPTAPSPSPYQLKHKSQNEGHSLGSWAGVLHAFGHTAFSQGPQFPLVTPLPHYFNGREALINHGI